MTDAPLSLAYDWLPADDTRSVVCILCNGANPTETAFTFILNGVAFSIERCVTDDLMYLAPQPGARYASAVYNHPSYFDVPNDQYGHAVDEDKGHATGRLRVDDLRERGGVPHTFLEIGCGLGYTLDAFKEAGAEVVGIEFSESSAASCRARGLNVSAASLDEVVPESVRSHAPFDAVALYSVLEHVSDPAHFLERIAPLLSQEGRLIVRVPKMSKDGPWLSLLDHFWHFTPASLERLLKKTGFAILHEFDSGTFVGPESGEKLTSMTAIAVKA